MQDALARGYRMGFTAGSAHQTEHGVEGRHCGAFVPPALKREYVWDAIYDRLTYGTTGARILVSLKINSAPMGSEVKAIGDAPVTIEGAVLGTDTPSPNCFAGTIRSSRPGPARQCLRLHPGGHRRERRLLLPARHPEGRAHGLSSPIWVDRA